MRLSKIDLSKIVAVGHSDGYLGLLIDRGEEVEYIEIPAPNAAYQGLQQVNSLAAPDTTALPPVETPAMQPVNSSMAKAIGYDCDRQTLQIEFNNGSVYQYTEVEQETWESLQTTDSTGRFFNREIKGNYHCQRVDAQNQVQTVTIDYSVSYTSEVDR